MKTVGEFKLHPRDEQQWRSIYMQNFHEKGLDGVEAYVKATVMLLEQLGYTMVKDNAENS